MPTRYIILLTLSGSAWFFVAGVVGAAVPIFGDHWFQHFVCAIITSLAIGIIFRSSILHWSGWRWYLLPLLSLMLATAVYGFLLPCSWFVTSFTHGGGVDSEGFYMIPMMFVFYSMTSFLVILYPLALLTHYLLRTCMRIHQKTPNPALQLTATRDDAGGCS